MRYYNKYDENKKMSKVKRDYDGKNYYVDGTFQEKLSLSAESIWPAEPFVWAWFHVKPYRSNVRRELMFNQPNSNLKRRYLE